MHNTMAATSTYNDHELFTVTTSARLPPIRVEGMQEAGPLHVAYAQFVRFSKQCYFVLVIESPRVGE